jgi:hypothetical protein
MQGWSIMGAEGEASSSSSSSYAKKKQKQSEVVDLTEEDIMDHDVSDDDGDGVGLSDGAGGEELEQDDAIIIGSSGSQGAGSGWKVVSRSSSSEEGDWPLDNL